MSEKLITTNRKARHDYVILETVEAGIALQGTEVKSLRAGRANLKDSYAAIKDGEVWLFHAHISPYDHGSVYNHDPVRPRKLLLHRQEIRCLARKVQERGLTLVPLRMYFKKGRAKVELALARGKHQYDRRQDITRRDAERDTQRELKEKYRIKL
ncbi:MAG: SsrA-binding protein SmpB [bacterium]|jgi:SsrA-binding protein|nr:SsrA-binding protein SmpB [candidate division KSB1 bacterium]MDH7558777.1 SsrA-binding protein SmpB [bacterium]